MKALTSSKKRESQTSAAATGVDINGGGSDDGFATAVVGSVSGAASVDVRCCCVGGEQPGMASPTSTRPSCSLQRIFRTLRRLIRRAITGVRAAAGQYLH